MKKALFIVALYLVPFFSFSQSSNIFEDGTIDLKEPETETVTKYHCNFADNEVQQIFGSPNIESLSLTCASYLTPLWMAIDNPYGEVANCSFSTDVTNSGGSVTLTNTRSCSNVDNNWQKSHPVIATFISTEQVKTCPPNGFPQHTSEYSFNSAQKCFNPAQANLEDSCDANSGNEYLTIPVTSPSGCFTQSDGSICKYNAVDVGGGNQYYAMDLEGDCYTEQLPDLDGTPQDTPTGDSCVDYGGGVLGCPEDPANVCSSGSGYAGGSISDCQTGCGMVNDQFLCIDNDTDGDGLPDYNDPDIDGDGIPNDDDLDSNGDGNDDPVNGGGGGGDFIDIGPIVNELKKLNKNFDDAGPQKGLDDDGQLTQLNDDYQTKLTELSEKTASQMGYVDSLDGLGNRTGLTSVLPTNECVNYSFHPAGKTIVLDICTVAEKVKPFLAWLFGLLTAWHIFFTINKTLREGV